MENEQQSLDEAMSAHYDKVTTESPPAPSDSEDVSPSPADAGDVSPQPEPAATPSERTRDEHGRFKAKEKDDEAPHVSEPSLNQNPDRPVGTAKAKPAAPDPWQGLGATKGDTEMLNALPEQAQAFIKRRIGELTRGIQDVLPLREYQPVAEMFKPYEAQLRMAGMSPANIIQRWAAAEQALQQNPVATLQRLAQMYGVDLGQLGGQAQQPQDQGGPSFLEGDPAFQRLRQELDWTRQQYQQQQISHLQGQIETFANQTGADGKLAHPYFEKVRGRMAPIVAMMEQSGRVPDLQAAYDEACWGTPEVREELLAAQRDAAARAAQAKSREKAAAAGRAGVSLGNGAPPPGSADRPAPQSLDATLQEAWSRFGNR